MLLVECIVLFLSILNVESVSRIGYDNEFFPYWLHERIDFEYYFTRYNDDRMYYALAEVRYCPSAATKTKLLLSSCTSTYQLEDLVQRMPYYVRRSVIYIFRDAHQLNLIDKSLKDFMGYFYSKNYYLATPVAAGPHNNGTPFGNIADLLFLNTDQNKYNFVLMFAESPVPGTPTGESKYTAKQLSSVAEQIDSLPNISVYILLDLYYTSQTDVGELDDWAKKFKTLAGIMFYNIPGQIKFQVTDMKKRMQKLSESVKKFIFLSEGDVRTQLFSYAPYVDWKYYEIDRATEVPTLTPISLEKFFADYRAMRLFNIQDCFGALILDNNCGAHPIYLDNLIIPIDRNERPILINVRTVTIFQTNKYIHIRNAPMFMVKVLPGPNVKSSGTVIPVNTLNFNISAVFVMAFDELPGPEKSYSAAHIAKLAELIGKVPAKTVGIRFSTEFLKEKPTGGFYDALCKLESYKYLILVEKCCGQTYSKEEKDNMKVNLNMMCHRRTYLFVSDELRDYIYIDDSIIDPDPPTTISTTTESTTEEDTRPPLPSGETYPTKTDLVFPTVLTTLAEEESKADTFTPSIILIVKCVILLKNLF